MKTYWDQFIEDFGKILPDKPLSLILESFWYYCLKGYGKDRALKILERQDKIHELNQTNK